MDLVAEKILSFIKLIIISYIIRKYDLKAISSSVKINKIMRTYNVAGD